MYSAMAMTTIIISEYGKITFIYFKPFLIKTAPVSGLSTAATDPCRRLIFWNSDSLATMAMVPSLIDEEMDGYVDLTPEDMTCSI